MLLIVSFSLISVTFRTFLSRPRMGSILSIIIKGSRLSFQLIYQCQLTKSSHYSRILTYFCISLCLDQRSKHFKDESPSLSRKLNSSRTSSILGCKLSQCSANLQTHSGLLQAYPLRHISRTGTNPSFSRSSLINREGTSLKLQDN